MVTWLSEQITKNALANPFSRFDLVQAKIAYTPVRTTVAYLSPPASALSTLLEPYMYLQRSKTGKPFI